MRKNNEFDEELKKTATSIEECTGKKIDRNRLCAEILKQAEICLENIESREYIKEYSRRELLTSNRITAMQGNTKIEGFAEGIDKNACLIVRLDNGSVIHLSSGEANKCRIID